MYNSGESEKCLGITPRSRSQLRSYLVEAAWIAIRKDTEMQNYYRKHQGKNIKSVIIKIAHKKWHAEFYQLLKLKPHIKLIEI
jgi:transposase